VKPSSCRSSSVSQISPVVMTSCSTRQVGHKSGSKQVRPTLPKADTFPSSIVLGADLSFAQSFSPTSLTNHFLARLFSSSSTNRLLVTQSCRYPITISSHTWEQSAHCQCTPRLAIAHTGRSVVVFYLKRPFTSPTSTFETPSYHESVSIPRNPSPAYLVSSAGYSIIGSLSRNKQLCLAVKPRAHACHTAAACCRRLISR